MAFILSVKAGQIAFALNASTVDLFHDWHLL